MRRSPPWLGSIVLCVILLPALAADDDTDSKPKPDTKEQKQIEKLVKSGKAFIGKLVKMDADKRIATVEVSYKTTKQDPHILQNLANLQFRMAEAQRNRNPIERQRQIAQIQLDIEKNTRNLYKDASQKIEFDMPDDMKVRTMLLPVELDDKGKPRRLTEKEKRELKGPDPALPGYTGDFDSLQPDQTVEVYLAKQASKSKPKDKDAATADNTRPRIAMLVILAEAKK
ncbi:MAG TPA: hypothetical protein VKU02_19475 [Gemmataceae bacterium]|nr:hypothetical protein [Gemmataceae bacterium]